MRSRIVLVYVLLLCVISAPLGSSAASTTPFKCRDGSMSRPATADEAKSATAGGIVAGITQLCPEDRVLGFTEDVGKAKEFLMSRYVIGPRSAPCVKTKEEGIRPLNNDFAVRAARMIQDMEAQLGGKNIIRSAVRPPPCDNGFAHPSGCAIDIEYANARGDKWLDSSWNYSNVPEIQWIKDNGSNAKYRLHFRIPRGPEWHHVEPMDIDGCLAGRALDPSVEGVQSTGSSSSPWQNAMRAVQNFFTPPPPPVVCPPGYIFLNGQCFPQQAVAPAINPFNYYPPAATSTTSTSTINTNTNINISVSDMINSSGNTKSGTSTAAIDLINALAGESEEQTSTVTGSVVALNAALANSVALQGGLHASSSSISPTSTYALAPANMQTFVSQDLNKTPPRPYTATNASTFSALNDLRVILLSILQMLRPFGGVISHPPVSNTNSTTVHLK